MSHTSCPICHAHSRIILDAPAASIRDSLAKMLGQKPPLMSNIADYKLSQCLGCRLEFADPMVAGDDCFYDWLTRVETYYPPTRWEWDICVTALKSIETITQPVLVDVGCGSGAFLSMVSSATAWRAVGLDFAYESIEACRQKGLEVFHGRVEDSLAFANEGVDAFTLWHVVEHVENPLELLRSAKTRLRPGGRIFFSVPLSPTSSEMSGLDPLNFAPHHLTRWSPQALTVLAETLELETTLFVPTARNWFVRALRSLSLHVFSPFLQKSRAWKISRLLGYVVLHPLVAARDMIRQIGREKLKGHTLPDVILVCMSAPKADTQARPIRISFVD